jgi:hypothetical protein
MSVPEIIELADVPAEYKYVQELKCTGCGRRVTANRKGSSPGPGGRMHDFWDISCSNCNTTKSIILSVPSPFSGWFK